VLERHSPFADLPAIGSLLKPALSDFGQGLLLADLVQPPYDAEWFSGRFEPIKVGLPSFPSDLQL
jgi:hypothetical protein